MSQIQGPFDGRRAAFTLAVMAIVLAALNLRGGIVVVGPLVDDIQTSRQLSSSSFSLLTTLPLLCFGVISALVPRLAGRVTPPLLVLMALGLITVGVVLRVLPQYALIMTGTLALGAAIAVLNVLIPGLVKAYFPNQTGIMTGVYSVLLSMGAGLGVYLAVPLRDWSGDWRVPTLLWAATPFLAALPWLYLLRVRIQTYKPRIAASGSLLRNPKAWALTGFMGLQSLFFYSCATWLPKLLMDAGLSAADSGTAAAMLNIVGIPANLLTPIIAAKLSNQRGLMLLTALCGLAGLGGLLLAPTAAPFFWASLLGLCGGASISLALVLFALRTTDGMAATALSAMAQSIGYFIAAGGPTLLGWLHDIQGNWSWALLVLITAQVVQLLCGWFVGKEGEISAR